MSYMDRVILHSDINACYASVELLFRPELRGRPVAVGGDEERRHGIVLAKSEEAKRAGVKTGMTLWQARTLCPELVVLPPRFDRYIHYSREMQRIYSEYTDRREPFGIDESWLDITGCLRAGEGERCAKEIGARIKRELGLTVSVGVSWNKVFAKLGSDYRKPDAVTVIDRANYRDIVWPLPAEELLFVGRSTRVRLAALGIHTIGDLARTEERVLKLRLGKMGELLHAYANGLDNSPVLREGEYPPAKSVGNGTTTPRDMRSLEDAMPVVVSLCECVGARLRRMGMRAGVLTLELRSPELSWISHRRCLARHTDCDRELLETALGLLREAHEWPAPLRSLAVRAEGLIPSAAPEQLDLFTDRADLERQRRLDAAVDRLRGRFGSGAVQRGAVFADPEMAVPPAQEEFSFVRKLG